MDINLLFSALLSAGSHSSSRRRASARRRRTPDGGYFHKSDRAAGIVGVLATGLGIMMFFVDSGEATVVQAVHVGSVTVVAVLLLLLTRFLEHPFQDGPGGLRSTAMQRPHTLLKHDLAGLGVTASLLCNAVGVRR